MRILRCCTVLIAATGAALLAARALVTSLPRDPGTADPVSAAIVLLATLALLACLVWLWLCVTAVAIDALRRRPVGGRWSRRAPAGLRRAVLALCGVAVGTGLGLGLAVPAGAASGGPAAGDPGDPGRPGLPVSAQATPAAAVDLDGLPLPVLPRTPSSHGVPRPSAGPPSGPSAGPPSTPSRTPAAISPTSPASPHPAPTTAPTTGPSTAPAEVRPEGGRHRVRPGESLWSIAADLLGPSADDAAIAAAWPALYRANAAHIGADPDLLLPGTDLTLPASLGRTPR
ncbi:hypothetical protein GCM10022215_10430 [Nocardioides fonticola]|uniref:LysM domain-containing protein n=1 Tax=Nocardioides fonticola TaxID=450363 RepID=A0ABP7XE83_9ACTN